MKKSLIGALLIGAAALAHAGDVPFQDSATIRNQTADGTTVAVEGDLTQTLSPHHYLLKDKKGQLEIVVPKTVQGSDLLRPGTRTKVVGEVDRDDDGTRVDVERIVDINGARPDLMNIHKSSVFKRQ